MLIGGLKALVRPSQFAIPVSLVLSHSPQLSEPADDPRWPVLSVSVAEPETRRHEMLSSVTWHGCPGWDSPGVRRMQCDPWLE